MNNSKIVGLGKYLPDNIVSNADLEKIMDTTDVLGYKKELELEKEGTL